MGLLLHLGSQSLILYFITVQLFELAVNVEKSVVDELVYVLPLIGSSFVIFPTTRLQEEQLVVYLLEPRVWFLCLVESKLSSVKTIFHVTQFDSQVLLNNGFELGLVVKDRHCQVLDQFACLRVVCESVDVGLPSPEPILFRLLKFLLGSILGLFFS